MPSDSDFSLYRLSVLLVDDAHVGAADGAGALGGRHAVLKHNALGVINFLLDLTLWTVSLSHMVLSRFLYEPAGESGD